MFKEDSFYPEKKKIMPRGSGNKTQKLSLDAQKLTATSAKSKGRGAGNKSTNKSQPKQGASTSTSRSKKENVNPSQGNVELAPLEEDFTDAESLSGGVHEQEPDVEDIEVPPEEDEDDFMWKCHLLEYVEQYSMLYDKAYPDFKNKHAINACWEEIATSLDAEGITSTLYLSSNFFNSCL